MDLRIGNGFDIHSFSDDPDRPLMLGGVFIPDCPGLEGHSDADVITHSICDALLGATGLGDLGRLFPDTDERFRGADSFDLLAEVTSRVRGAGWRVVNVDCSVIAERPKLAPHRAAMELRLSEAVGGAVSIKGRRAEGLGALGRSEGIVCLTSALLCREESVS